MARLLCLLGIHGWVLEWTFHGIETKYQHMRCSRCSRTRIAWSRRSWPEDY